MMDIDAIFSRNKRCAFCWSGKSGCFGVTYSIYQLPDHQRIGPLQHKCLSSLLSEVGIFGAQRSRALETYSRFGIVTLVVYQPKRLFVFYQAE